MLCQPHLTIWELPSNTPTIGNLTTRRCERANAVTVFSPGGAFWSVAIHAGSANPAKMAQAALDAMRMEYEGLEAEPVSQSIDGHELSGFDLNFFYLDLTSTAAIRSLQVDGTTYTIFFQAEDREYREIERVFAAMTVSLLRGIFTTM